MAKEEKTEEQATDYFAQMAGDGLEDFTPDTISTSWLSMVQPGSGAEENHPAGTWRDSATDENYGNIVSVIPLQFKTVWVERSKEPPFGTIGRYIPKSIKVDIEYPKPGARGFPKMTNPETGNVIQELFAYAVLLKDKPENGVMYFSPTVISMSTCKTWNKLLMTAKLPPDPKTGRVLPAALHQYSWDLEVGLVPNPKRPNSQTAKLLGVKRGQLVDETWHRNQVKPMLDVAKSAPQLIALPAEEEIEE